VRLPLQAVIRADQAPERAAAGPVGQTIEYEAATLDGLKVLIVDDERASLELVKRVLEERHAQVFTAESAAEGMELVQRARPDVIVSDIGMPGEDGYQFMRRVRALETTRGGATPALALTAFSGADPQQRAILAGYQAHLSKPVEVPQLIATVAGLAGRITYVNPTRQSAAGAAKP
jgi:CheY-like chemotaxis protein